MYNCSKLNSIFHSEEPSVGENIPSIYQTKVTAPQNVLYDISSEYANESVSEFNLFGENGFQTHGEKKEARKRKASLSKSMSDAAIMLTQNTK